MDVTTSRRALLAGIGAATASAGCVGRVRNIAGRDSSSQVVLNITTPPADEDPHGIRIARHLSTHLQEIGIDSRVNTVSEADLHRDVLLNHDFEIYVGQYPDAEPFDPDALYSLTHSRFTAESGWQNPFGLTNATVDELLDRQRITDGPERADAVAELQHAVCDEQPFTVVAFPDALTAVREDRFRGWDLTRPTSERGLLKLEYAGDDAEDATLRLTTTDERLTENLNPIAAEYRRHGTFTGLMYDPLVRLKNGEEIPWLATNIDWNPGTETLRFSIRDAEWHDGTAVTPEDVTFTYEFLNDTSMGNAESPIPAPRFRGRSSIVEAASVVDAGVVDDDALNDDAGDDDAGDDGAVDDGAADGRVVELTFEGIGETVARRALQIPVLPEHVWSEFTGVATIAGFELNEEATEALVRNNEEPIGSGPLMFEEATPEETVSFVTNDNHFLRREPGDIPTEYHGAPDYDRLVLEVVPSDIAAVQYVGDGRADATASNIGPEAVPRVGREADARLVSTRSAAFYHIGYNVRNAPLSNFRFRTVLASLIDKAALIDETFQGYAQPAASPLAATPEWVPTDLTWDYDDEADPKHPFFGDNGSLDAEAARETLREMGYSYNEAGELLVRGQ